MKASANNRFDELIRERFMDFSENPPASVLEKIKATTSGISNPIPFWRKGGFFATIGIVLISGITILLINSFSKDNINKADKILAVNNSQNNVSTNNNKEIINNDFYQNDEKNSNNSLQNINSTNTDATIIANNETENINESSNSEKSYPVNHNEQDFNSSNIDPNIVVNATIRPATCRRANGKVILTANYENIDFYWTDIDNEKPHSIMENLRSGNYNIRYTSKTGLIKKFMVTVTDSSVLRAGFTHYSMSDVIGVPVYFYNKSTIDNKSTGDFESISYKWYFGDGYTSNEFEPEHMFSSTGPFNVSLVTTNTLGCKDSAALPPLNIASSSIDPPNIFTPNGDGINDIYKPVAEGLSNFHCIILNRNGETIYEWKDPTQGWDGKLNHGTQMASEGTYFYVIYGIGIDGKEQGKQGFFNLSLK